VPVVVVVVMPVTVVMGVSEQVSCRDSTSIDANRGEPTNIYTPQLAMPGKPWSGSCVWGQ
jgi:hypothetical protein